MPNSFYLKMIISMRKSGLFFISGLFLVFLISILACEKTTTSPEKTLQGEWAYVGTYDSRNTYPCLICDGFEPSAAIYTLNFLSENTYTGKVNLLIIKGEYVLSDIKNSEKGFTAGFENISMEILNKPYETEADGKVKNLLESATRVEIKSKNAVQIRDLLILSSDGFEYLVYARK